MKHNSIDRRTVYSKNAIKEAFFSLIREKPLQNITVISLCKRANINRGTFYKYYADVEDFLFKSGMETLENLKALVEKQTLYTQDIDEVIEQKSEISILMDPIVVSNMGAERVNSYLKAIYETIIPLVRLYVKEHYPDYTEMQVELMSVYRIAGFTYVLMNWNKMDKENRPSIHEIRQLFEYKN